MRNRFKRSIILLVSPAICIAVAYIVAELVYSFVFLNLEAFNWDIPWMPIRAFFISFEIFMLVVIAFED